MHNDDPELSDELDKAHAMAAPYQEQVQFRLDLLINDNVNFNDRFMWIRNSANDMVIKNYPPYHHFMILDTEKGFICEDLK